MKLEYKTKLVNDYKTVRIEVNNQWVEIDSDLLENLITSLNILKAVAEEWGIEQTAGVFENNYKRGKGIREKGHDVDTCSKK